jgi:hypothetical protein
MFADKDRIVQGRSRRFVHKRSLYRTCSKSAQYLTNVDKKNCIEDVIMYSLSSERLVDIKITKFYARSNKILG